MRQFVRTLAGAIVFLMGMMQGLASAQTITAAVSPSSTPVGVGINAAFAAQITDPALIQGSVNLLKYDALGRSSIMGAMRDDGLEGDAVAGDRMFTLRFNVYEETLGTLTYRVSAAFQGRVSRVLSAPITLTVTGTVPTDITLSQPTNLAFVNTTAIIVSGTSGDPSATVTVNGIQANKSGNTFQASVPLQEGNNTLTAVAKNTNGSNSTASIQVTLDTTPPRLMVEFPPSGYVTSEASVSFSGMINDIVVGTVNSQQAQVSVKGVAAQVANRTFSAPNVPLQLGLNDIAVIGRDQTGNSVAQTIHVTREAPAAQSIKLISGNNQTAAIGSVAPLPLVVQLLDGGKPAPGKPVSFRVTENDGFLAPGSSKAQVIVINTDAQGQAKANWTLGNHAGNNIVQAYAGGFTGTAVFTGAGTTKTPAKISIDSGANQFGAVNDPLALPFVAVVTDQGYNRLANVSVTFTIKQGGGNLGGATTLQTKTDSDGRALAVLTLGSQPGQDNNLVEATFTGNTGFAAAFTASARIPGDPTKTTISGVVLDGSNNPIPGTTMRLFQIRQGTTNNQPAQVGTPVRTDAKGLFKITGAPSGFFKLMADGTTATLAGKQFPTLEYDIVTVAGLDNGVGMPIYLPELDADAKLCVNETTGGVLKLVKSPGFSLTVAPGSAIFPGGSRTGCITVTPVNPDKVPMVPGFGEQPRYVVTIQPVGTRFTVPAAMTMPNMDGLAPRAKTEMYSFDHDLASFVAIGTGTVSDDGSVIASDPGVGVIKAGWHCGGNPNPTGSAGTCPQCQACIGNSCQADPAQACTCCGSGNGGVCTSGTCTPLSGSSCSTNTVVVPNVVIVGNPDPSQCGPGMAGATHGPLTLPATPQVAACVSGKCTWSLRVRGPFDLPVFSGLCLPNPGINVQSANSAILNPVNYCKAIKDLTPDATGRPGNDSDPGIFTSFPIVTRHENFHVREVETVLRANWPAFESTVEAISEAVSCGPKPPVRPWLGTSQRLMRHF